VCSSDVHRIDVQRTLFDNLIVLAIVKCDCYNGDPWPFNLMSKGILLYVMRYFLHFAFTFVINIIIDETNIRVHFVNNITY
jgi:hypothetical protein